jgi:uncharacterized membrane protein YidH (DUF202 family)
MAAAMADLRSAGASVGDGRPRGKPTLALDRHDRTAYGDRTVKPISIIGALLIVAGIAALVLGEVSFTKRETVVQIGDAKLEAETRESFPLPPVAGIAGIVVGVVLVVVGYRRR